MDSWIRGQELYPLSFLLGHTNQALLIAGEKKGFPVLWSSRESISESVLVWIHLSCWVTSSVHSISYEVFPQYNTRSVALALLQIAHLLHARIRFVFFFLAVSHKGLTHWCIKTGGHFLGSLAVCIESTQAYLFALMQAKPSSQHVCDPSFPLWHKAIVWLLVKCWEANPGKVSICKIVLLAFHVRSHCIRDAACRSMGGGVRPSMRPPRTNSL